MFGRKPSRRVEVIASEPVDDVPVEAGFSLEDLGNAYAAAIQSTANPKQDEDSPSSSSVSTNISSSFEQAEESLEPPVPVESDGIPVTADSLLEAILFIGNKSNEPFATSQLVETLRLRDEQEIAESVERLNRMYTQNHRATRIVRERNGYRMQLASGLESAREQFYGKQKETQLTQTAIDCLSLVAYQPGITKEELETQWNQPAGAVLGMLIRKGLLRLDQPSDRPADFDPDHFRLQSTRAAEDPPKKSLSKHGRYFTTEKFLEILGIDSLEDLPRGDEL